MSYSIGKKERERNMILVNEKTFILEGPMLINHIGG